MIGLDRPEAVFIGDSITEFWLDEDPWLFWPRIINRGIRGETTREMRARFDRDVVAARPCVAHIMGGTNDLWFGDPGEDAGIALGNIREMTAAARTHGIRVVLAPPPPIGSIAAPLFAHIRLLAPLADGIRRIAEEEGVVYVDYAAALTDEAGGLRPRYTTDGVHLTRAGYRAMRAQAEAALCAALAGVRPPS